MLQLANKNNVILRCVLSHTTQTLQLLDKFFLGHLKGLKFKKVTTWFINNIEKPLSQYHILKIIDNAWYKSAIPAMVVLVFKATEIYFFDLNAIPEYFFRISDALVRNSEDNLKLINNNPQSIQNINDFSSPSTSTFLTNQNVQMPTSHVFVVSSKEM